MFKHSASYFLVKALRTGALLCLTALAASNAAAASYMEWADKVGADLNISYEGTRVMETKDGRFEFKERKAPGKHYMGMNFGGMTGVLIMREDLGTAYMLMPEMNMYREMPEVEAKNQSHAQMDLSKVEKVGRETIGGFASTKYKTHFKDKDGKGAGFVWVTDSGVPIKMDMIYKNRRMKGQRMTMELQDLQIRNQAASHFEIPNGYSSMNLGAMMRNAARSNAQAGTSARSVPADNDQGPTIAEDLGATVRDETRSELKEGARESIRKGIRGLFKR
ncbi:MAG: DUF4412 domain-containing protein [Pseudomonadales bacterium]